MLLTFKNMNYTKKEKYIINYAEIECFHRNRYNGIGYIYTETASMISPDYIEIKYHENPFKTVDLNCIYKIDYSKIIDAI